MQGRTENNRAVIFAPGASGDALIGQLVDVRITESLDYSLRGELVANLDTIALAS